MRRRFYGVFLRGQEHLAAHDPGRSVLLCANHTNWWDGFAAALMAPFLPGRAIYLAQYEKLLAHYPPLRWLGVFGLERGGPEAIPSLRYALRLLAAPPTALWIFPQGVLLPQWQPIVARRGTLWLARRTGAHVVPIVFRFEWMTESRPSLFIRCGPPLPANADEATLSRAMQTLYDAIDPADFRHDTPLFHPQLSLNKLWEVWAWPWVGRGERFEPEHE